MPFLIFLEENAAFWTILKTLQFTYKKDMPKGQYEAKGIIARGKMGQITRGGGGGKSGVIAPFAP